MANRLCRSGGTVRTGGALENHYWEYVEFAYDSSLRPTAETISGSWDKVLIEAAKGPKGAVSTPIPALAARARVVSWETVVISPEGNVFVIFISRELRYPRCHAANHFLRARLFRRRRDAGANSSRVEIEAAAIHRLRAGNRDADHHEYGGARCGIAGRRGPALVWLRSHER